MDLKATTLVTGLVLTGAVACTTLPPPRPVHRDALTAIELRTDPQLGDGHSHPATVTSAQMRAVLSGIRVQKRTDPVLSLVTGEAVAMPAFSPVEVDALAPRLGQALAMALPGEIVTFYRRYSDANVGLAVTSGGLFIRDHYVYFILANHRNRPADVMGHSQAMVYEIDPSESPLFSLKALSFAVSFSPEIAVEPHPRWPRQYVDPGKAIVLDLHWLDQKPKPDR
jgi:hypothetical protein